MIFMPWFDTHGKIHLTLDIVKMRKNNKIVVYRWDIVSSVNIYFHVWKYEIDISIYAMWITNW